MKEGRLEERAVAPSRKVHTEGLGLRLGQLGYQICHAAESEHCAEANHLACHRYEQNQRHHGGACTTKQAMRLPLHSTRFAEDGCSLQVGASYLVSSNLPPGTSGQLLECLEAVVVPSLHCHQLSINNQTD